MKYKLVGNNVEINGISNFNLQETFDCGQCFRWSQVSDNEFEGVAFNKYLKICKKGDTLILLNTSESDFKHIWKNYFDLDLDYSKVKMNLSKINKTMKQACAYAPGIRILAQEPWEALCSFIISQNNNIPRIKGIISRLCENFGDKIFSRMYSFPDAKTISHLNEKDLETLRCGFRSSYILDAAKKVASGEIDFTKIKSMEINSARDELKKIKGVGPKVAECTLLYGMHRLEAFPIDVWMQKAMSKLFYGMTARDFGEYAGIAQQYIFHYSRMNPDLVK